MADTEGSELSDKADLQKTRYMIHHVFLPPQLPQQHDSNPLFEDFLLNTVLDSLYAFERLTVQNDIQPVIAMIENSRAVRDEFGDIDEVNLKEALKRLGEKGMLINPS